MCFSLYKKFDSHSYWASCRGSWYRPVWRSCVTWIHVLHGMIVICHFGCEIQNMPAVQNKRLPSMIKQLPENEKQFAPDFRCHFWRENHLKKTLLFRCELLVWDFVTSFASDCCGPLWQARWRLQRLGQAEDEAPKWFFNGWSTYPFPKVPLLEIAGLLLRAWLNH